jgi:hypothetical protein
VTPPQSVGRAHGSPSACNKSRRQKIVEAQSMFEILLYGQNMYVLIYNTAQNRAHAFINLSVVNAFTFFFLEE